MTTLTEKLQQAISIYRQKSAAAQQLHNELLQLEGSINTLKELVEADATDGEEDGE
jgi:hypothetical protein